jgi:aldose 1-epimerase
VVTAPDPIHHLAEARNWQQAQQAGEYRQSTLGRTLEDEGFIHCSTPQQVAGVLSRYYAAHEGDLVLLTIDLARLTAPLRWDVANPATGEQFPHIYGALNPDAVVATRVLHPPHAAAPQAITLRADGIELEVLAAGASVRRLRLGHDPATALDVVLGHADPQTYRFAGGYLGATIGRLANRLAGGSFAIGDETFHVPTNEGTTTLHGGFNGFDRMPWHVTQRTDTQVRLTLTSPDGDNGFPGTVEVRVSYTVSPGQVRIDYTATTGRATPFNITNHAYFNLDGEGSGTVDDHELELTASAMLPIDEVNLPTGEIRPVEGTAFDLREPRRVGDVLAADDEQLRRGKGLGPHVRARRARRRDRTAPRGSTARGERPSARGAHRPAGGAGLHRRTLRPLDPGAVGGDVRPSGRHRPGDPGVPGCRAPPHLPRHRAAPRHPVALDDDLAPALTARRSSDGTQQFPGAI